MLSPNERLTWTEHFMGIAMIAALRSPDPSTKVGAVIVAPDNSIVSTGYNGFPRGVEGTEEEYLNKEYKYATVVHAEANAVYNAGRNGNSAEGCSMYGPWLACRECCKSIIQAGIVSIHGLLMPPSNQWNKSVEEGYSLLKKAGVKIELSHPHEFTNIQDMPLVFSGKTYSLKEVGDLVNEG